MKSSIWNKLWKSCVCGAGLFALSVFANATNVASAQDCPFADDEVIIYHSPSSFAETDALRAVWDCDEGRAAADEIFKKLESGFAESAQQDDFPKEKVDYLFGKLKEALGEDLSAVSVLKAYFQHFNGVVFSFDVPKELSDAENGAAATYILDFNPGDVEVRKLFKEGEELTVVKEENGIFVGKLTVTVKSDGADEEKSFYFGGVKIKDLDKYAVVFSLSQEIVETKLIRFQASNKFVVDRLGAENVLVDVILKPELFAKISEMIDEKDNLGAKDAFQKIVSVRFRELGSENGLELTFEMKTIDAETAQAFVDLAVGGVAAVGLATSGKELNSEEELGLQLLKKIEFSVDADESCAKAELTLDTEFIRALHKTFLWDKIKEALNKDSAEE